tara:strand:+ start:34 stop:780 length:747 start_codon:yes stop_codon:yes gene_type:complete
MLGLGNSIIGGAALSEVLPSDISGLQIWYKNATGLTGDPVSQWSDSSGNGRHAVQGDSDLQGSVSDGGIDFSDAVPQDFYTITESSGYVDMGGTNAFTLAVVMKRENAAADDITLVGGTSHNNVIMFLSEEVVRYRNAGSGGANVEATFATDTWEVNDKLLFTMVKDTSGNLEFYKNGAQVTPSFNSNHPNTGLGLDARFLGTRTDGTHDSNDFQFDGIIYEFALYNTELTGDDLSNLNNHLTSKFSL